MPWGDSRPEMPPGWDKVRASVLQRSDICYVCGRRGADEVDHVKPRHQGGGEGGNLRPIHSSPCHARKSAMEGVAQRAKLRAMKKRPPPRHPGRRGG
ncbi:HNH endonuclease [Mycobacterium phage DreamCatcher]|nr:HNH endonuclease [Mycobacterium phage DreamCatcher]